MTLVKIDHVLHEEKDDVKMQSACLMYTIQQSHETERRCVTAEHKLSYARLIIVFHNWSFDHEDRQPLNIIGQWKQRIKRQTQTTEKFLFAHDNNCFVFNENNTIIYS